MITNDGKQLIGKFILGQAPSFATHIAAGVGPNTLLPDEELSATVINELKEKQNLDFEVFRVPISAKGFIKEDGVEKIVFKAEMPTEQRYQITEVGFYPASENSVAGSYDSKALATFVPTETWVLRTAQSSSTITNITDDALVSNSNGDLIVNDIAFFINSNAAIFEEQDRKDRQEAPRYYNKALVASGDSNYISDTFTLLGDYYAIDNSTLSFNFSQNLPPDEVKLAFSLLSTETTNNVNPERVRILLDFVNDISGIEVSAPKARAVIDLPGTDFIIPETATRPEAIGRYKVVTTQLSEFTRDDTFSWANVNVVRLYVCVISEQTVAISNTQVDGNGIATLFLADSHTLVDGMSFDVASAGSPFDANNIPLLSASANAITFQTTSGSLAYTSSSGSVTYSGKTSDYKIVIDGLRLDNVSSQNPLYSLVGYDIIRNDNAYPVLKAENTNNYIEYRFGIGVDTSG